jgi:hypothetical protein
VVKAWPSLPPAIRAGIRTGAASALAFMDRVLAAGTLEEKRELVALYVRRVEAVPARQTVRISLYPAPRCSLGTGSG